MPSEFGCLSSSDGPSACFFHSPSISVSGLSVAKIGWETYYSSKFNSLSCHLFICNSSKHLSQYSTCLLHLMTRFDRMYAIKLGYLAQASPQGRVLGTYTDPLCLYASFISRHASHKIIIFFHVACPLIQPRVCVNFGTTTASSTPPPHSLLVPNLCHPLSLCHLHDWRIRAQHQGRTRMRMGGPIPKAC